MLYEIGLVSSTGCTGGRLHVVCRDCTAHLKHMLSMRRETARSTQRTLLQRLQLRYTGYCSGCCRFRHFWSTCSTQDLLIHKFYHLLLLAPLTLLSMFFLAVAGILLFLRLYPLFLRLGAYGDNEQAAECRAHARPGTDGT